MGVNPLITVAVPAYNAERTLAETLGSVSAQTYRNIEIIVTVDGAKDGTEAVALQAAAQDPRIRVLVTENRGAAAARNTAARAGSGDFIAPIDADDLWHPEKLERQLAVAQRMGPQLGFVYTPYRLIDPRGIVVGSSPRGDAGPRVYLRMLLVNLVGNGSALLVPRAVFESVGGYEPEMRERHLEGVEDLLFQIRVARHWDVGLAPGYLTAYRRHPSSLSSNLIRMREAKVTLFDRIAELYPETPAQFLAAARAAALADLAVHQFRATDLQGGLASTRKALNLAPATVANFLIDRIERRLQRGLRRLGRMAGAMQRTAAKPFEAYDIDEQARDWSDRLLSDLLPLMAAAEAALDTRPHDIPFSDPPVRMAVPSASAA